MKILNNSDSFTRVQALRAYDQILKETKPLGREALLEVYRRLATSDLFFLLVYVLGRVDIGKEDFLYARCREVQKSPNNHIDLWAREHYKSTIITFGYTIFELIQNPELTFGIFSHTKSLAEDFLKQIKREFEDNQLLKEMFPDVLWENPQKQAPTWNVSDGIIVKRKSNPKECTIEAHGLVEGQPTGKHFNRLIYDDVVTLSSVATPGQIEKTTTAYKISLNLGAHGGKKRIIGTRYHFNDTYADIMRNEKSLIPRIYPATKNGRFDGVPVFLTREQLDAKREAMGPYIFSCQMLQNPKEDGVDGFKEEWLRYYDRTKLFGENQPLLNIYILVDPSSQKKKDSDYTVFWVIATAQDNNVYVVDVVRDRLNLTERASKLFELVRKYKPVMVAYERYGMQADVEHMQDKMEREFFRFNITEVGGKMPKTDRIKRLIPKFEAGKIFLPNGLVYTNSDGKTINLIRHFVEEEFIAFPVCAHDDMLDALSRMFDIDIQYPELISYLGRRRHKTAQTEYDYANYGSY